MNKAVEERSQNVCGPAASVTQDLGINTELHSSPCLEVTESESLG